jgi:hypothetical protein
VDEAKISTIADFLRRRNEIDADIAAIIQRPMTAGHLGEWLAKEIFGINLEPNAATPAIDGRFTTGAVAGRTVNVKWYLKREGLLDVTSSPSLDYYLVLTGPASAALSTRGGTRPWCIEAIYLFDARQLLDELLARGVKIGTAASVRIAQWHAAEIYPQATNNLLPLTAEQTKLLRLFALADTGKTPN